MFYEVIGYVVSFGIGLGPVMWLLISEIYPTKIRGKAMSLATLSVWGANWVVAATFLSLFEPRGRRTPSGFTLSSAPWPSSFVTSSFLKPKAAHWKPLNTIGGTLGKRLKGKGWRPESVGSLATGRGGLNSL